MRAPILFMIAIVATSTACVAVASAETPNSADADAKVRAAVTAELGFLDPLAHEIQFGRNRREFDYVEEGGQDVLFQFGRLSADVAFGRHHAIFLYQPLRLDARVQLDRAITFDSTTFPAGTPVDVTYGFPFYRASYLYDFASSSDREIAAGVSLQLRNATIDFTAVDGSKRFAERDVGPVPILKFRTRVPLGSSYWFGGEADGFYAPISYLNGDDNDVIGAILDASVRGGYRIVPNLDAFLNFRYLGGGSRGVNPDEREPGDDGFTENWLHFATVSLGFTYHLP